MAQTIVILPALALILAGGLIDWLAPAAYLTLGNVLMGAGLTLGATLITEAWRRTRERKDLAIALYFELANRVARCCIDFDAPWSDFWERPVKVNRFRLGKFVPEPMLVLKANANKLSLFANDIPAAVMGFQFRLWTLNRDIENARGEEAATHSGDIGPDNVRLIARRFGAALEPGRDALTAMSRLVPGWREIERKALGALDPQKLRFDGSLRDFLERLVARRVDIVARVDRSAG